MNSVFRLESSNLLHGGTQFSGRKIQLSQDEMHILRLEGGNFSQSGNVCSSGRRIIVSTSQPGGSQSSYRKMCVSNSLDHRSPNRESKISPWQISFFRPEVGTWYLVYQGRPPGNRMRTGVVMGDQVRLSKSSNWKLRKSPRQDSFSILQSEVGAWHFGLSRGPP